MAEEEFEIYPAKALFHVIQWRSLRWMTRRYIKIVARRNKTLGLIESIAIWQWYKALIHAMRKKDFWHEIEHRPKTIEEVAQDKAPKIPGNQRWKGYYIDTPAWKMAWRQADSKERMEMDRWKWRVQKGLEVNGGQT
jgi:hypothetical protein